MSNPVTVTPPSNATPFASAFRASAVTIRTAFAMPSRRDAVRAQDVLGVQQRRPLRGLRRGQQLRALDAVGAREALPALQVLDALGRRRDLERTDPVPAGLAVQVEAVIERDRVLRDPAHRAGAVRLEDQARGVRGGSAGLEERALIEDQDVGHAQLGEVVRGGGADDAGADDHRFRTWLHPCSVSRRVAQGNAGVADEAT